MRRKQARFRIALAALLAIAASAPSTLRAEPAGKVRTRSFELLNEGVAAYNRGEYALAVEKLQASAAMALNSFRAYYFLGLALTGQRDYPGAIESLEVALDLDPNHLQSLVALGDAQLKLGDVGEARAAYYRAIKLRAGYAPALDGIARCYEAQAEDEQAIEHYRQALASDRGFAPVYTHLGDLYLRQERFQEAVRLLEEAVRIRPDFAAGMNRLALAYGRLGMSGEAVATIHAAIGLEPASAAHRATLGVLELARGLVNGAERSFRAALEREPGMPEARLGLAEVARLRGEYARAIEELDGALAAEHLDPRTERRLIDFRAAIVAEQERVAGLEARAAGGEATAADLDGLVEVYAGRGRWQDAADLQARAGESPERRERLAYLLFRAGRFRDALLHYGDLGRGGDLALVLNTGVTLAKLGDDPGALAVYDRILEDRPDHRLARLYRANALLRLGRRPEAAAAYRAFLDQDERGEAAERVRRILKQIAPELVPPEALPIPPAPPPPPPAGPETTEERS